MKNTVYL